MVEKEPLTALLPIKAWDFSALAVIKVLPENINHHF